MIYQHIPVMLKEAIEYLQPKLGGKFIDCTLGGAGYTLALSKLVGSKGKIIAIDLDKLALDHAGAIIKERGLGNVILINDNFANIDEIAKEHNLTSLDGIVMDLGLSSAQLDDPERGFSFKKDGPLNMAFNNTGHKTYGVINQAEAKELEYIFKTYGEERFAKQIANKIIEARKENPINTTKQLVEIIKSAVPTAYLHKKIHFATRTFQALRIATNKELVSLETILPKALKLLKPGGRLVVVSFHSLEDRLVKQFFKTESKDCLCSPKAPVCRCNHEKQLKIITKKPQTATEKEIEDNPKSRSAKLRVAEKITK